MRAFISRSQFLTSFILYGINTIIFSYFLYTIYLNPRQLIYFTRISYILNSIYLFICLICDSVFYLLNSRILEKINDICRNKIAIVFNSESYLVFFVYWTTYVFDGMKTVDSPWKWFKTINQHLIIVFLVIIDILVHNHNNIHYNLKYHFYCLVILFAYALELYIHLFILKLPTPYHQFNEHKSRFFLNLFISVIVLSFSYLCNIYIHNFKYKVILRTKNDYYDTLEEDVNKKKK